MSLLAIQSAHLRDLSATLTTLTHTLTMITYAIAQTSAGLTAYIVELQDNADGLASSVSELKQEQADNAKVDLGEEIAMMRELVAELKEDVADLIRNGGKGHGKADDVDAAGAMVKMRSDLDELKDALKGMNIASDTRCPKHAHRAEVED